MTLLTIEQVSDYLQLRPSTIYKLTHRRAIPHIKLGGRLRFSQAAIDAWLAARDVPTEEGGRGHKPTLSAAS